MDIEDVVLVATVREDIRNHALQVVGAEIPRPVEAGKLVPPVVPAGVKSTSVSNEADTAPTQETTSTKAVPQPELSGDPVPVVLQQTFTHCHLSPKRILQVPSNPPPPSRRHPFLPHKSPS